MSGNYRRAILLAVLSIVAGAAVNSATPMSGLEGHLTIIAAGEVDLADSTTPAAMAYAKYPLVILTQDGKEVAHVTADGKGNYGVVLAPGNYILDVKGRARGHLRAKPQRFTVKAGKMTRADLTIDPGIR